MKTVVAVLALVLPSLTVAQVPQLLPPPPEEPSVVLGTPIALADSLLLEDEDRRRLEYKALRGDADSATRVAQHFNTDAARDRVQEHFWWTIAAENGSASAQYNLWFVGHDSLDPDDRVRALFWLERAATAGSAEAITQVRKPGSRPDDNLPSP